MITHTHISQWLILNLCSGQLNENWVFRRTHVSPFQALSEKGNNSKSIESKHLTSSDVLPLISMSVCKVKCQYLWNFLRYAPRKKKWKREITLKVMMPELCTSGILLSLIILCPWMKLHYNFISRTGDIIRTRKSVKGE